MASGVNNPGGGVDGTITGNHPAIDDPIDVQDLTGYLEETNRPAITPASTPSTIYVETTGNDVTGDGSSGTPFATIFKALQLIGTLNSATITVQLGAGSFEMPPLLSEMNWITIVGTTSIQEGRTISTVDTLTDAGGIALTLGGAALTNDELRGQLIQWTSGAANGDFGWVYRNTANQVFVTNEDPTSIPAIVATDTLDFISLDTSIEYTDTPIIQNSVALNIQKVNVIDDLANGRVLFILTTDKVEYRYCNWTMARPQVGGFGRAHFWCNYIGTKGATNRGCFAGVNGSFVQLERGTVIDCGLNTSAANKRFIQFAAGATVSYSGQVVIRQIDDAKGVQCDGAIWSATGGIDAHDTLRFETEGASASCIAGFVVNTTGEGLGGNMQLPNLHGEVTSSYIVTAQKNVFIELGSSGSVTTNTVTNAISANGGTSAISRASDGTNILEGVPAFVANFGFVTAIDETDSPYSLDLSNTDVLQVETNTSTVTVALPSLADITPGGGVFIQDISYNANTNNITVNRDGSDTVDNATSLTISTNGESVYLKADHVNDNWIRS